MPLVRPSAFIHGLSPTSPTSALLANLEDELSTMPNPADIYAGGLNVRDCPIIVSAIVKSVTASLQAAFKPEARSFALGKPCIRMIRLVSFAVRCIRAGESLSLQDAFSSVDGTELADLAAKSMAALAFGRYVSAAVTQSARVYLNGRASSNTGLWTLVQDLGIGATDWILRAGVEHSKSNVSPVTPPFTASN